MPIANRRHMVPSSSYEQDIVSTCNIHVKLCSHETDYVNIQHTYIDIKHASINMHRIVVMNEAIELIKWFFGAFCDFKLHLQRQLLLL